MTSVTSAPDCRARPKISSPYFQTRRRSGGIFGSDLNQHLYGQKLCEIMDTSSFLRRVCGLSLRDWLRSLEGFRVEPVLLHIEEPVEVAQASSQDASVVRCSGDVPPRGGLEEDQGHAGGAMVEHLKITLEESGSLFISCCICDLTPDKQKSMDGISICVT